MSDIGASDHGFVSRLRVIEQQPLADRAGAYASLHDELSRRLDSGVPRSTETPA